MSEVAGDETVASKRTRLLVRLIAGLLATNAVLLTILAVLVDRRVDNPVHIWCSHEKTEKTLFGTRTVCEDPLRGRISQEQWLEIVRSAPGELVRLPLKGPGKAAE